MDVEHDDEMVTATLSPFIIILFSPINNKGACYHLLKYCYHFYLMITYKREVFVWKKKEKLSQLGSIHN